MKMLPTWLPAAYRALLRLYPKAFREVYAAEMQSVFTHALSDARQRGALPVLRLCSRELLELPLAALVEHQHERNRTMLTNPPVARTPWWIALAASGPFFIAILDAVALDAPPTVKLVLAPSLLLFCVSILLVEIIRQRQVPFWVLVYVGFFLFGAFANLAAPFLDRISWIRSLYDSLGDTDQLSMRLAWSLLSSLSLWSILLLLTAAGLGLAWMLPVARNLARSALQHWDYLVLLLYGAVPFLYLVEFDSYRYDQPFSSTGIACLGLGVLFFLRSRSRGGRLLALLAGMSAAYWIMAVSKYYLVPLQTWEYWFNHNPVETERWFESLSTLLSWVVMLGALSLPALLSRWQAKVAVEAEDATAQELPPAHSARPGN
jgi:hypothetical protein